MSGGAQPPAVLLDSCAVIWLAEGSPMDDEALTAIAHAAGAEGLLVSPISAWEVGLLSRPKAGRGVTFLPDPDIWFARDKSGSVSGLRYSRSSENPV